MYYQYGSTIMTQILHISESLVEPCLIVVAWV